MSAQDRLDAALERARGSVFVDPDLIDTIESRVRAGRITPQLAEQNLRALLAGDPLSPGFLSPEQIDSEWTSLMDGMESEAKRWQEIAGQQYRQGFLLLPLALIAVLAAMGAGIQWLGLSETAVIALATSSLATLALHSFLVFRVHQQARIAAERLSEKRAATLFLRLALAQSAPADAPAILSMAAAMFLGHQAPATLPLSADDFSRKTGDKP